MLGARVLRFDAGLPLAYDEAKIVMSAGNRRVRYPLVMLALAFIIAFLLPLLLFGTAPVVTVVLTEMSLSHAQ